MIVLLFFVFFFLLFVHSWVGYRVILKIAFDNMEFWLGGWDNDLVLLRII